MNIEVVDKMLRRITTSRLILSTLAICLLLWSLYDTWYRTPRSSRPAPSVVKDETSKRERAPSPAVGNMPSADLGLQFYPLRESTLADSLSLEQKVAQTRSLATKAKAEELQALIGRWKERLARWENLQVQIYKEDAGKRLAVEESELTLAAEMLQKGEKAVKSFSALEPQIQATTDEVASFFRESPNGVVTPNTKSLVDEMLVDAELLQDQISEAITYLERRIDATKSLTPGRQSFDEALASVRNRQDREILERVARAREEMQRESANSILEAEREKEAVALRIKLQELQRDRDRLLAEEERLVSEAAIEMGEERQRQQAAALEAEFISDRTEVDSLLSPFVSLSNHDLYPPQGVQFTPQKVPVSLSRLTAYGALDDSEDGLDKMALLGINDSRPLGSFPRYSPNEWRRNQAVKEKLQRAQELLRKYGELMVKKGLLLK